MTATAYCVAALVVLACICDIQTRRIPNLLTFGAALLGLAFHTVDGGWGGMAFSAAGWAVGCALFLPLFVIRGMGAGDVKLLAAIGAWLGPGQAVWVALVTSVAGGVLGLIVALGHGYLTQAVANIWMLLRTWGRIGIRAVPALTLEQHHGPKLPYAVPILVGTMVTLWLQ